MVSNLKLASIPITPGFNGTKKCFTLNPKVFGDKVPEGAQSIQILQPKPQIN